MIIPAMISDICTAVVGPYFRLGVHEGSATLLIEVFAKPPHIAWLIGREGQMVRALQVIAEAAGKREDVQVYLRLEEE